MNEERITNEEIIPRPIGRVKAQLIAKLKLGLKDVLVFASVIVLFALVSFLSLKNMWLKLSIGLVVPVLIGVFLLVGEPNRRVYNNLYKLVIFLASKKKYTKNDIDKVIPYSYVDGKTIKTKDGKFVSVLRIMGNNVENLKPNQQDYILGQFGNFFKGLASSVFINKIEGNINTEAHIKHLKKRISLTENKERLGLLQHNLEILETIGKEDNRVPLYYVTLSHRNTSTLEDNIKVIQNELQQSTLMCMRLEGKELFKYTTNSFIPNSKEITLDYEEGNKNYLIDKLGIEKVETKASYIRINNKKFMRVIAIDQYPIKSSLAWLSTIYNLPNTSVYNRIQGLSQAQASKLLDKAYQEMRMRAIGSNVSKLSETSNQAIYMSSMEELSNKVASTGERLMLNNLYIVIYGNDLRELRQREREVLGEVSKNRMKADKLTFKQLDAWLSLTSNGDVNNFYERNMLEIGSSAMAHSFPFTSESFNDKTGNYIGYSMTGKPVMIDYAYRNAKENRNQSNSIIFGATGKGKSTMVKKTLKDEFASGTKVYVIDPENEYEDLALNLKGKYIDLSGKENGKGIIERINPLQPFATQEAKQDILGNHYKFLEAFFKGLLYPSATDVVLEMGYMKYAIASLYKDKNVTPSSKAEAWPTLTELYNHLMKLSKAEGVNKQFSNKEQFKELAERMYDLTNQGSDGNLWDGITTLDVSNNNFVVFNIQELYSTGNLRLVNSQMFLVLKYLEYLVQKNKRDNKATDGKPVTSSITIDEAHLLVNKDNPTTLNFAYNMYKRIRKYDGWVRMVTQNIADFTGDDRVKRETSAILNSAQFMFIFGLNPKDINDLNELLAENGGLTSYEKQFLNIGETHSAIFLSGSQYRSTINFEYTYEEKQVWGWKD